MQQSSRCPLALQLCFKGQRQRLSPAQPLSRDKQRHPPALVFISSQGDSHRTAGNKRFGKMRADATAPQLWFATGLLSRLDVLYWAVEYSLNSLSLQWFGSFLWLRFEK